MDITRDHILQRFEEIDTNDHHQRIHFYEANTSSIFTLDENDQFYFTWQYVNALFEVGKYENMLAEIDSVIEYSFINDIEFLPVGTFQNLLFKKASALYNTYEYDKCITIAEQLIGINTDNRLYQLLAMKAHRSSFNQKSTGIRLSAILLIFSSSIVSAVLWLMSSSKDEKSLITTFFVVISPCLFALVILAGAHGWSYLRSMKQVAKVVFEKRAKKG